MAESHSYRHSGTMQADRPPWEIGRPQPALLDLSGVGSFRGRVLDVGCGTGEHVLLAADLGLEATGIDLDPLALRGAEEKATARDLTASFVRHEAMHLAELGEAYDTVLDCALFHAFGAADRAAYVKGLRSVTRPGGRVFMLCYSDQQAGPSWCHRIGSREARSKRRSPTAGGSTPSWPPRWMSRSTPPASEHGSSPPSGSEPMITAEARIRTDRPRRYLEQLFRHASRMTSHPTSDGHGHTHAPPTVQHAEWSGSYGTARTSWGRWSARAGTDVLTVLAEATDPINLSLIQTLLTTRLETIGRRDGLKVSWKSIDGDSHVA